MEDIKYYQHIAASLIERDRDLKSTVMPEMDAMGNNEWNMPADIQKLKWLVARVDSSPRNAEIAGVRSYSTMMPNVSIIRPANNPETRKRFSQIEDLLKYQYMLASSRPSQDVFGGVDAFFGATPTDKLLRSAIRYGSVAAQVVHIPTQLGYMGKVKESRKRAIRQFGDFAINIHNPQNIHERISNFLLEGVLLKKYESLASFVGFWGEKAKPLLKSIKGEEDRDKLFVCSYDYQDFDVRAVWATVTQQSSASYTTFLDHVSGTQILLEEHDMPFLPWVVRGGVEPLNYAVYKTKAWHAANLSESLTYTETVRYAAAPRVKITGPNPDSVVINYDEPGNPAKVPAGHDIEDMSPPAINEAHVMSSDRSRGDIRGMTVPSVVTALDSQANEAFSTFDQRLRSGLSAYTPYKELAERALEEIFCHMLYWSKYTNTPLSSPYANDVRGKRVYSFGEMGEAFVLDPETVSYDLKTSVELSPVSLLDKMSEITAATNMVQYLGFDKARALELLGENNPEQIEKDKAQELLRDTKVQGELVKLQAQSQVEAQAITAGIGGLLPFLQDPQLAEIARQTLEQVVGQYLQQQQQAAPQGEVPAENVGGAPGMEGVDGQMFNPAMGGTPPAQANPRGNTREFQRGMDRQGNQT